MKDEKLPICRNCMWCVPKGRGQSQTGDYGRKYYYCENPTAIAMKDAKGRDIHNFVGFGDMSWDSPLALKTRKRWCPKVRK